ncbi:hypothetical protein DZB91_16650 [Brevibacillus sp. VP]|nr:hypothetical protein DZB91_16650 [Brevibacillus sp. VP]
MTSVWSHFFCYSENKSFTLFSLSNLKKRLCLTTAKPFSLGSTHFLHRFYIFFLYNKPILWRREI